MATTIRIPGFLPSTAGLRFANAWPHEPDLAVRLAGRTIVGIGDAADGLCGGMTFVAADRWAARAPAWPDETPPPMDSPHFQAIVRRQVDSLAWGRLPLRFYSLMAFRPDRPTVLSRILRRDPRATVTVRDEWPKIRAELDAGRPVAIGLVRAASPNPLRLNRNHQVLAYGYDLEPSRLALAVYDPNHPLDDSVALRVDLTPDGRSASISQSTGEPLLAFFRAPYRPKPPTE
ncbi:MAG: hypothetical protein ACYDAK_01255 [Candidatus Limnocylindrales bacterium]